MMQVAEADAIELLVVANDSKVFPTSFAPSGAPPGILVLRI
jgi:hypothetical protein